MKGKGIRMPSVMDKILLAAHHATVPYNKDLLKNFRQQEIDRIIDYIDGTVFKEAVKLFTDQGLTYEGYRYLSPEERTTREISANSTRSGVNIRVTEAVLVEFQFKFEGIIYPVPIYIPYLKDGFLVIKGVRYGTQFVIMEKSFSRGSTGVTVKCLRSPVHFNRVNIPLTTIFSAVDMTNYHIPLLTVKIYQKKKTADTSRNYTTIIHYLMCEYGYEQTLRIFGVDPEKMKFVPAIDKDDTDKYEYLYARKISKTRPNIYLRIDRDVWDQDIPRKIAGNLAWMLMQFTSHGIAELYEPAGSIYRVYLGKLLHGRTTPEPRAKAHADQHLTSLVTYLDPTTRQRLMTGAGIQVSTIHDLFKVMFLSLETILTNTKRADMLDRRIDILDSLLVPTLVSRVYNMFYRVERKQNPLRDKDVRDLLKIPSDVILKPARGQQANTTPTLQSVTSLYSDNILLAMDARRIRSGSSSPSMELHENRFDPSVAIVTTINAHSDSNPGSSGQINPMLVIDMSDGSIVRTPIADKLEAEMKPYLPYEG